MEKIEVGEYLRTEYGITKLLKKKTLIDCPGQIIYTFDNLAEELWSGDLPNEMWQSEIEWQTEEWGNPFIKHSKNIIDLIEVGDYVNGNEVVTVYGYDEDGNDRDDRGIIEVDDDYAYGVYLEDINIFSIVTKEQFASMEYKIQN